MEDEAQEGRRADAEAPEGRGLHFTSHLHFDMSSSSLMFMFITTAPLSAAAAHQDCGDYCWSDNVDQLHSPSAFVTRKQNMASIHIHRINMLATRGQQARDLSRN